MLYAEKKKFVKLEKMIGKFFSYLPLSPNLYTSFSLVASSLACFFILSHKFMLAGASFLVAGLMDIIDGAVAREKNEVSRKGAYFDTIADRYVEIMIYLALLLTEYPQILLPAQFWTGFLMANSLMTTYVKAAGMEKKLIKSEIKGGIFERPERIILILLILFMSEFSKYAAVILIIAGSILSLISSVQRILITVRNK